MSIQREKTHSYACWQRQFHFGELGICTYPDYLLTVQSQAVFLVNFVVFRSLRKDLTVRGLDSNSGECHKLNQFLFPPESLELLLYFRLAYEATQTMFPG